MRRDAGLGYILNVLKASDKTVLLIFLAYALIRLFLSFKAYWIWGDEAKYLACAKSFPFNRMFNHSYYDFHPVFYPYMIRLFSLFFKDHIAAIAVSFFSSLVLFIMVYWLFLFLNLPKKLIYAALTYLAFNHVLVAFSNIPFRYELFACLFFLSFYMYLKLLTTLKFRYLLLSALFGGLTFMTSDMMPFMLLLTILGAFFVFEFNWRSRFGMQLKKILPLFLITLIYISCVLLPKFIIYSTHTYYAGGMEGRIEKVSNFSLKQLIHPVYFPNADAIWGKMQLSVDLGPSHIINKLLTVIELHKHNSVASSQFFLFLMALPVIIMLLELLFKARLFFKDRSFLIVALKKYKVNLYLFIMSFGLLYPVIYTGFFSRNSIAAIPFLAYFFARGLGMIFSINKIKNITENKPVQRFAIFVLFVLTFSIIHNRYFIFTLDRIEASDKVGAVLDSLPKDGVLSEGLIADALVYNCNKRIVVLPRSPDPEAAREQTDLSIKVFDLHYVVLSEFYKIELGILAYPAVEYIQKNPDKFKLIKTAYEHYNKGVPSNILRDDDIFYIYEVLENKADK